MEDLEVSLPVEEIKAIELAERRLNIRMRDAARRLRDAGRRYAALFTLLRYAWVTRKKVAARFELMSYTKNNWD